ncbi:LysR family transcriptional regulator [Caulobacter sp. KR2-114]|uniref:LysR family transcriptional regulator n=1 Tax=Caulobacter sp. KR2-114 TaxID=3400912 RepID=UPI003C011101
MNTEPDWSLFQSFLAVAEEGSLSAAARRLGLTQPTLARHVDALEAAVGAALFLRTQRGLSPTEAAVGLIPYARTIAANAAAFVRAAADGAGRVEGAVRISASEIIGVELLPPVLAGLRRRHPALAIELSLTDALDDLLRREADIAVRNGAPQQDVLLARRLPSIRLGLFAHRDYLARRGTPADPAGLAGHELIGFDRETPFIRALASGLPQFRRADFALRVDSNLAQLAAIRAGLGIGLCQAGVARRDPALVAVLPEAVGFDMETWVLMHEDLKSSPRCRATFDAIADGLTAAIEG